jgi:sugar phosphate isomerase/epimerase
MQALRVDSAARFAGNTSMTLSLSVRVAESFHSKETASMGLEALAALAARSGYSALCMRASQAGVHSSKAEVEKAAAILQKHQLRVTMVTGDFDIVYNNDAAPNCLRHIGPYLELARAFGAPLIRVALKTDQDISRAQRAADEAAEQGLKLAHQCHTQSLFETVDNIERTLRQIDRPNFGLVYEPANLELCAQTYGPETLRRLEPWIFNVYLQNQVLKPDGKWTLKTWCRGTVPFDLIPIHQQGGIDFRRVFEGLAAINYRGPVTVHQAQIGSETVEESVKATATYLQALPEGRFVR